MTFTRKFDALLRKSNKDIVQINYDDGISLNYYDNNYKLLFSKQIMDGTFSFIDCWFDINNNDIIYGIINNKKDSLYYCCIYDRYIIKNKISTYDSSDVNIKFTYIKRYEDTTNIFYYTLNTSYPYKASLINCYKNNGIWNTYVIDDFSYNVLTNYVVIYDNVNSPVIFYFKLDQGYEELFFSRFNMGRWSEPVQITHSKKPKIYLSIIRDSKDEIHILFSENNDNKYYCKYIHGSIKNNDFHTINSSIIGNTVACTFPNIIEYKNKLYANWIEYHNLYVRSSTDYGLSWSRISISNQSAVVPIDCCNYHMNNLNNNIEDNLNYYTVFMPQNSTKILGLE